jgi:hypothetical protein
MNGARGHQRSWLIGISLALLVCAGAGAQERDRPEDPGRPKDLRLSEIEFDAVFNVATFAFDAYYRSETDPDVGILNELPIGVELEPDSFGPGRKLFYFRNRRPFLMREDTSLSFRVRIGNTSEIYVWPESWPDIAEWDVSIRQLFEDGREWDSISDMLPSGKFLFMSVEPDTIVEIRVTLRAKSQNLQRELWVTVSPDLFDRGPGDTILPRPSSVYPR